MNNEPVARVNNEGFIVEIDEMLLKEGTLLYTHPVKELTDEEIAKIRKAVWDDNKFISEIFNDFARAILRKAQENG